MDITRAGLSPCLLSVADSVQTEGGGTAEARNEEHEELSSAWRGSKWSGKKFKNPLLAVQLARMNRLRELPRGTIGVHT